MHFPCKRPALLVEKYRLCLSCAEGSNSCRLCFSVCALLRPGFFIRSVPRACLWLVRRRRHAGRQRPDIDLLLMLQKCAAAQRTLPQDGAAVLGRIALMLPLCCRRCAPPGCCRKEGKACILTDSCMLRSGPRSVLCF